MNLHLAQRSAQLAARNRATMAKAGKTYWGTALWTEPEDELLRSHYPDYNQLCEKLPHRSRKAIRTRCELLNIARKLHWWTAREISKLRKLWTSGTRAELREAFPDRSWKSILRAAESRHFKRPRVSYVRVKSEHMNAIRDRCFELGYIIKDIDELARTLSYFENGASYRPRPDMKKIDRAVRALDGKLVVVWNE